MQSVMFCNPRWRLIYERGSPLSTYMQHFGMICVVGGTELARTIAHRRRRKSLPRSACSGVAFTIARVGITEYRCSRSPGWPAEVTQPISFERYRTCCHHIV